MILEARDLTAATTAPYDVCIVGAGPAGIALANRLADSSLKTCVVESGGRAVSAFTDGLRAVESHGIAIKDYSRERVLGGASTTWSGLSSPLDDIDFRHRAWVPHSGWPLTREDLEPYYRTASGMFRFPSWDHLSSLSWLPGGLPQDIPCWREVEEKTLLSADPPQNFGVEFGAVFASRVDLILGATVTNIEGESTGHATGVRLALPSGKAQTIRARVTVLACGGIENARLLLTSTFGCADGLGNDRGQVGRYFMNHPKGYCGSIALTKPQGALPGYFGFLLPGRGYAGYAGLRLTPQTQEREGALNSYVRFEPVFDWSDDPAVDALVHYTKRSSLLMRAFKRANRDQLVELRSYAETGDDSDAANQRKDLRAHMKTLAGLARHWRTVARYASTRLAHRPAPAVISIRLRNFLEMAPDPDNRVELSDRVDAFGMRLPSVTHRCGPLDRHSVVVLHRTLGDEVAAAGWGRLQSDLNEHADVWPMDYDASHHMGATRMGADPATSVTTRDCRLHTTDTVCLAGASLFPTSGCANPTYTLVALALRLGDHLKERLLPAR